MLAEAQKQYALPVFTPRAEIEAPEHSLDFDPGNENGIVDVKAEEIPEAEPEAPQNGGLGTFLADVLDTIPYYNHAKHITNTLKKLGYAGYKQSLENEMYLALADYANQKANEEAQ